MNKLINRQEYLDQLSTWREQEIIKVVTGVRRCGKSTLFQLYIDRLKSDGVTEDQIVSIDLESKAHSGLADHNKLHDYVEARIVDGKCTYVFIDEIQNCKDYERAVASLFLKKNVDIYITGSNAYMLSGELATKLSGRYVEVDMLPLSFLEYSEVVKNEDRRERFLEFMNAGAFPFATRFVGNSLAQDQYLEGIYNTVLVRDVITRKGLNLYSCEFMRLQTRRIQPQPVVSS